MLYKIKYLRERVFLCSELQDFVFKIMINYYKNNGYTILLNSFLRRLIIFFSSREIYDWEMPNKSATSFCVFALSPTKPKRNSIICFSLSFNWYKDFFNK